MSTISKKIIILILLVATVVLLIPQGVTAQADPLRPLLTASCADISGYVAWFLGCPTLTFLGWVLSAILAIVSTLFMVFSLFFEQMIVFTLDPLTYNINAIKIGWTIVRDTANMFFIFVLLAIAIATILQIETYGARRLLPKLIIAALFINFSFILTQYVIFSSNLLATFFIPSDISQIPIILQRTLQPSNMFSSTDVSPAEAPTLMERISRSALRSNPLAVVSASFISFLGRVTGITAAITGEPSSREQSLLEAVVAAVGVIIFLSMAMFTLAFIGISLLIRVVILWFLMILAPMAFLFFVVPGLTGEARRWWNTLIKQAIFAPAFFFLFGVTLLIVQQTDVQTLLGAFPGTGAFITSFGVIAYYMLIIVMLLGSVLAAKVLGGVSTQWAYKGARAATGAVVGYVGTKGRKYAVEAGGAAGRAGTQAMEGEGRVARTMRRVPLAAKTFGAMEKAQVEQTKKEARKQERKYGQYSTEALKNIESSSTLLMKKGEKEAVKNILEKRRKKEEENEILKTGNSLEQIAILLKRSEEAREEQKTEQKKNETKT